MCLIHLHVYMLFLMILQFCVQFLPTVPSILVGLYNTTDSHYINRCVADRCIYLCLCHPTISHPITSLEADVRFHKIQTQYK